VTVAYFLERRGAAAFATAAHLGAMTHLQVLSVVAMQVAAVVTYIATVRANIVPVMAKIAAIMLDVTLITVARHPVLPDVLPFGPDLLPLLARVSLVAFAQVLAHRGAVSCDLRPVLIDVALLLVARASVLGQVATIVRALAAVVPQIAPVLLRVGLLGYCDAAEGQ
jgi:hypothetical protein